MLDKNSLNNGSKDSVDRQNVSAWVDNELKTVSSEDSYGFESEEIQLWSRYHLIGQVMRDEVQHFDRDISSQINAQISKEPSHTVEQSKPQSNVIAFPKQVFKQIGGFAIAASVALVVLFNASNQGPAGTELSSVDGLASTGSSHSAPAEAAALTRVDRQELQTIHDMFLKHEALSQSSLLPSVQVVSNQKVIPVSVPLRVEQPQSQAGDESSPENTESQQP